MAAPTPIAIRDKFATVLGLVNIAVTAAIVSLMFWQLPNNQKGMQDRLGALFFGMLNQAFGGMFRVLQVNGRLEIDRYRERSSSWIYALFDFMHLFSLRTCAVVPTRAHYFHAGTSSWTLPFKQLFLGEMHVRAADSNRLPGGVLCHLM